MFADDQALLVADPDHCADEDRFLLLGASLQLRILVVCHCYRRNDEVIRLISARPATWTEQLEYMRRRL